MCTGCRSTHSYIRMRAIPPLRCAQTGMRVVVHSHVPCCRIWRVQLGRWGKLGGNMRRLGRCSVGGPTCVRVLYLLPHLLGTYWGGLLGRVWPNRTGPRDSTSSRSSPRALCGRFPLVIAMCGRISMVLVSISFGWFWIAFASSHHGSPPTEPIFYVP